MTSNIAATKGKCPHCNVIQKVSLRILKIRAYHVSPTKSRPGRVVRNCVACGKQVTFTIPIPESVEEFE
jgi:uncharacterized Zn finger protein